MWLGAVEYYTERIDSVNVPLGLDPEDGVSFACYKNMKNYLTSIQITFSCIVKTLKSLENRHISLSKFFEIIDSRPTVEQLNSVKVADDVRAKVNTRTLDMTNLKKACCCDECLLNSEGKLKLISVRNCEKYASVTSNIERIFSQHKSDLRGIIRRFVFST